MYGAKEVMMRSREGTKWLRLAVGKVFFICDFGCYCCLALAFLTTTQQYHDTNELHAIYFQHTDAPLNTVAV